MITGKELVYRVTTLTFLCFLLASARTVCCQLKVGRVTTLLTGRKKLMQLRKNDIFNTDFLAAQ